MATPQVLSRKANGVLPVAPAQTANETTKPAKTKAPVEGEKVVIRRLPPGLTEEEFAKIMGDDWKVGSGKVDWFSYKAGKISQDPAKPSRPSRAYLHVKKRDDLVALSDAVRTAVWEDAKETWTSPSLIGPATTEFAIYKKVPSGKRRNDGRQGTIDQDQEFMDFLEALANPAAAQKDGDNDPGSEEGGKSEAKATSTPLIEYLREKKANKAKEAANAKSAKHARQESQGGKGKAAAEESKKRSKESKDKAADKPKETVRILTKRQAADAAAEAAKTVASQLTGSSSQEAPKSRRAGIAAAARILERDLGLSPGTAHRRARMEAAKQDAAKKAEADVKAPSAKEDAARPATPTSQGRPPTPTAPKSQAQQSKASRGKKGNAGEPAKGKSAGEKSGDGAAPAASKAPVILTKKKDEAAPPASGTAQATAGSSTAMPPTGPKSGQAKGGSGSQKKGNAAAPTPGATKAFVKHANPSQGVTEALLKEAMTAFGSVTFVEIDRRKGFAYVDFEDHNGLVKAIAASPVHVGQAAVQVLERKDPPKKAAAAASTGAAAPASATTSNGPAPATAGGPSAPADKAAAGSEHKRPGRRRGGRGKGEGARDGGAKDGTNGPGSKTAEQDAAAAAPSTPATAATASSSVG